MPGFRGAQRTPILGTYGTSGQSLGAASMAEN
jgi:hypothetical protein